MERDKLTEKEKALFASLSKHQTPPSELESSTISTLRKKGLIKKAGTRRWLNWKIPTAIAASLMLFFFGHYFGGIILGQGPTTGYMLLLHEDENFIAGDPEERFSEYAAWMGGIFTKGYDITGQELSPEATNVGNDQDASKEERITGYFILEATTMDEVVQIVKTSPHVKYGGTIEIKEILKN